MMKDYDGTTANDHVLKVWLENSEAQVPGEPGKDGYSIRHAEGVYSENTAIQKSTISPDENIQVGDQIIDNEGHLFEVSSVSDNDVIVGNLLANLRGATGSAILTYSKDILSGSTNNRRDKTSSEKVKTGDSVIDSKGDVYKVTAVNGDVFSVGNVLFSIKGEPGVTSLSLQQVTNVGAATTNPITMTQNSQESIYSATSTFIGKGKTGEGADAIYSAAMRANSDSLRLQHTKNDNTSTYTELTDDADVLKVAKVDATGKITESKNLSTLMQEKIPAEASSKASGLMSSADKVKLDGLRNYELPAASSEVLGGIKVGAGLQVQDGKLTTTTESKTFANPERITRGESLDLLAKTTTNGVYQCQGGTFTNAPSGTNDSAGAIVWDCGAGQMSAIISDGAYNGDMYYSSGQSGWHKISDKVATQSMNGWMSKEDKTKLDNLQSKIDELTSRIDKLESLVNK